MVRAALALAGLIFFGAALIAASDRDVAGATVMVGLGIVCLGAARSGRDPLNEQGAFKSFRLTSLAEEVEAARRDDEEKAPR